jgi:hypothetical protein
MMRACLVADLLPIARNPRDGITNLRSIEAICLATTGSKSPSERSLA